MRIIIGVLVFVAGVTISILLIEAFNNPVGLLLAFIGGVVAGWIISGDIL